MPACVSSPDLTCAETPRLETLGAVTWRLVGMPATDDAGTMTPAGLEALRAQMPKELDPIGRASFEQSLRTSNEGVWVVHAVDAARGEEILSDVFERHRSVEDRTEGPEEPFSMPSTGIIPTSWRGKEVAPTNPNCPASYGWLAWSDDNREGLSPPFNDRQTAIVYLNVNGKGASGVMLDDRHAMTVAHVMSPSAPHTCPFNESDIDVYLAATGEIREGSECYIATGSGVVGATDVAIVKLASAFSAAHNTMILSDASNTALEAEDARVLGFPSRIDTTGTCNTYTNMVRSPGADVLDVTSDAGPLQRGEVRTKNDNSQGQSGGPIYYCPTNANNNCAAGEATYVFGVTSGYVPNGQSSYNLGAKIPGFYHDWLHVVIPNLP